MSWNIDRVSRTLVAVAVVVSISLAYACAQVATDDDQRSTRGSYSSNKKLRSVAISPVTVVSLMRVTNFGVPSASSKIATPRSSRT
jgi:hypothetical protein